MDTKEPPLDDQKGRTDLESAPALPPTLAPSLSAEEQELADKEQEKKALVPFLGLLLCLFLAALDQTIIATALPSIAADLGATPSQYSWVGTSYLLLTTTLTPCYGRLSDLIGRKIIMYIAILIFILGSALCGAAQSMIWLIASRAVQGIGGGGIMAMTTITVGDIVPLRKRSTYQGMLGGVWGISSVLGPLLGGLLADSRGGGWRWCFFINLPSCGVALVVLFFFLKIENTKRATWPEFAKAFDWIGWALMVVALACVVVGFSQATDHGFQNPAALALIIIGVCGLALAVVHFLTTKKRGILPRAVFTNPTTAICLVLSYLQAFSFLSTTFYLPQFFQAVVGTSALMSGVMMLPFSLSVSIVAAPTGILISKYGRIRIPIRIGYATACLGFGLMLLLDERSSTAVNLIMPFLVGIGIGMSLTPPLQIIQAALDPSEMAAGTSSFLIARALGATTGISTSGAILSTVLKRRLSSIAGYTYTGVPTSTSEYRALHNLTPPALRQNVLHQFARSIQTLFPVYCAFCGTCFLLSWLVKHYHMDRVNVSREKGDKSRPSSRAPSLRGSPEKEPGSPILNASEDGEATLAGVPEGEGPKAEKGQLKSL